MIRMRDQGKDPSAQTKKAPVVKLGIIKLAYGKGEVCTSPIRFLAPHLQQPKKLGHSHLKPTLKTLKHFHAEHYWLPARSGSAYSETLAGPMLNWLRRSRCGQDGRGPGWLSCRSTVALPANPRHTTSPEQTRPRPTARWTGRDCLITIQIDTLW